MFLEKIDARINLGEPKLTYDTDIVIYELSVSDADAFLDYIQLECSFVRERKLKKAPPKPLEERKRQKVIQPRAGLDLYICQFANKPPAERNGMVLRKVGKKCGCKAKATLNFPSTYHHNKDGELNVQEFGDLMVKVTWHWEHNHETKSIKEFCAAPLTKRMKELVKIYGKNRVTYADIGEKTALDKANFDPSNPLEFLKLKRYHIENERRAILLSSAIKDVDPKESLRLWAKEINEEHGMAEIEFFGVLQDPHHVKYKENQAKLVWSFAFMSSWQKDLLKRDGQIFYFDSTQKTCLGFDKDEKVYLFTILVKSSSTGQGCPCAFLITNSQHSFVIADFLQKVKLFSFFEPSRVVIDCDQAEKLALQEVFPDIRIVFCRWHVQRAFRLKVHSKVKLGTSGELLTELKKRVQFDFRHILDSNSSDEALVRSSAFLEKYEMYPDLIEYYKRQWERELRVACASADVPSAMTNNYVEAWHSKLERCFLKTHRKRRVDVLVYTLLKKVEPSYHTDEIRIITGGGKRTHDKAEKQNQERIKKCSKEYISEKVLIANELDLLVSSFTTLDVQYSVVFLSESKNQATCSCPRYEKGNSWCKHIFLALRWYDLCASPVLQYTLVENPNMELHPIHKLLCESGLGNDNFLLPQMDAEVNVVPPSFEGVNSSFAPPMVLPSAVGMNSAFVPSMVPPSIGSHINFANLGYFDSPMGMRMGSLQFPVQVRDASFAPTTTAGVNPRLYTALTPTQLNNPANHYHNPSVTESTNLISIAKQASDGIFRDAVLGDYPVPPSTLPFNLEDKRKSGRNKPHTQVYVNQVRLELERKRERETLIQLTEKLANTHYLENAKEYKFLFETLHLHQKTLLNQIIKEVFKRVKTGDFGAKAGHY